MTNASLSRALLLSSLGLILLTGCDRRLIQAFSPAPLSSAADPATPTASSQTAPEAAPKPQASSKSQAASKSASKSIEANAAAGSASVSYRQALDRANSAAGIAQSAQSKDDWQLVVNRWQQAIGLMQTVPQSSPDYAQAQRKLAEYRRSLAQSQQQVSRVRLPKDPDAVIVMMPPVPARPALANRVPSPAAAATAPAPTAPSLRAFSAPIVRRAGNTPVIRVMFNGNQPFDMILDTGASGTLITRPMAAALGVTPVSEAIVNTASERGVSFPLGYVKSIEVGGAVSQNVLVAIAGPELDIGLLGHDFFGNYDLVIRADRVEFRERNGQG